MDAGCCGDGVLATVLQQKVKRAKGSELIFEKICCPSGVTGRKVTKNMNKQKFNVHEYLSGQKTEKTECDMTVSADFDIPGMMTYIKARFQELVEQFVAASSEAEQWNDEIDKIDICADWDISEISMKYTEFEKAWNHRNTLSNELSAFIEAITSITNDTDDDTLTYKDGTSFKEWELESATIELHGGIDWDKYEREITGEIYESLILSMKRSHAIPDNRYGRGLRFFYDSKLQSSSAIFRELDYIVDKFCLNKCCVPGRNGGIKAMNPEILRKVKDTALVLLKKPIRIIDDEIGSGLKLINHPFIPQNGVINGLEDKEQPSCKIISDDANMQEAIQFYKDAIEKAESINDILLLLQGPCHLTYLNLIQKGLSSDELGELLAYIWVNTESPNNGIIPLHTLIKWFKTASKQSLMDAAELAYYNSLPDEFTVYRGIGSKSNKNGISYTLSLEKAEWYAIRFNKKGYVLCGTAKKKDVLAFFNGRKEQEVLIQPKNIVHLHKI